MSKLDSLIRLHERTLDEARRENDRALVAWREAVAAVAARRRRGQRGTRRRRVRVVRAARSARASRPTASTGWRR